MKKNMRQGQTVNIINNPITAEGMRDNKGFKLQYIQGIYHH